jgi:hypothetical protein
MTCERVLDHAYRGDATASAAEFVRVGRGIAEFGRRRIGNPCLSLHVHSLQKIAAMGRGAFPEHVKRVRVRPADEKRYGQGTESKQVHKSDQTADQLRFALR